MIKFVIIGLFGLATISLVSYFMVLIFFYKKLGRGVINFKNTFPYEVSPQFKTEFFYINALLFLSLGSSIAALILFACNHVEVMPILFCSLGAVLEITLAIIPFINIKILKEHLYADLGLVVLFFATTGLMAFYSFNWSKAYDHHNASLMVALIISIVLFLFALFFIFDPKLFDLKMKVEEDKTERPKVFHLAFMEWTVMILSVIELIPLILICSVL